MLARPVNQVIVRISSAMWSWFGPLAGVFLLLPVRPIDASRPLLVDNEMSIESINRPSILLDVPEVSHPLLRYLSPGVSVQ